MALITIEGIDGAGKTTLVGHLKELLADLEPVFTREPGATWIGEQVRRAVRERVDPITEALLFAADHAAHLSTIVKPLLGEGRLVISDRYLDSRFAYQPVMLEGVMPDPKGWLRQLHGSWTVIPDRTFLLVIPVEAAMMRLSGNPGREHFENAEILRKVQRNYLDIVEGSPSRFVLVDALKEEDEIAHFVADEIRRIAGASRRRRPR